MILKLGHRFPSFCPFPGCLSAYQSPNSRCIVRHGFYSRSSDSKPRIARYRCKCCLRTFSQATLCEAYRQKKRHLNEKIRLLFVSNVSQRRIARLLGLHRTTIARKLVYLSLRAKLEHFKFLRTSLGAEELKELQFDEMESFEHTKCRPLSIPLIVSEKSRRILGLSVASMPAKGPLAEIARKKYPPRIDEREEVALKLFWKLAPYLPEDPHLLSDENPKYPRWIKGIWPKAKHRTVKGRKPRSQGQGELKVGAFDPLFPLNHTAAMLRANVNRLIRKTWCTTKRKDRLECHLWIYVQYHNQTLTTV